MSKMSAKSMKREMQREMKRLVKANYREFHGELLKLGVKERIKTGFGIIFKRPLPAKWQEDEVVSGKVQG